MTLQSVIEENEVPKSWAIYIDIEGFSANYSRDSGRVIAGLRSLMEGIYWIGTNFCAERSKRLCAFQAGDGFFIDSEYGSPDVAIAIAVLLMRNALLVGALTRVGISEGECVGISGWRPDIIRQKAENDRVRIGAGLMFLFPVMGSAYINAHKMTKAADKGCLLLIDTDLARRASVGSNVLPNSEGCNAIDWIHSDSAEIRQIAEVANMSLEVSGTLERRLQEEAREAASNFPSEKRLQSEEWLRNTLKLNHCE